VVTSQVRRPGSHSAYVRSPAGVRRPVGEWRIYRWWGYLPPESGLWRRFLAWLLGGWQQLLYLGQTGRQPIVRALEHAIDKSWCADALTLEIDPRVWRSEADVLAYEGAAIRRERPVHNVAHNGNNPGAVRVRRHLPAHVVRARLRWAGRLAVLVALWSGLWLAAGQVGVWPGWEGPRNAAVGAVLVVLAGWVVRVRRRPRRRRRW
jgi:hypothetical protein